MNDIDFLLDDEKQKMEQEVVASFIPSETEIFEKEEVKEEVPISKKKKADLVDDFMKLQEEKGEVKFSRSKLERMNKGQIIKELANFMNEAILPTKQAEPTSDAVSTVDAPPQPATGELNPHQLELVSQGLFQMNQVLISLLETGSQYAKDKTGGIAVLENWSLKTLEKKQQFLDVFKLIYKDYKVELDKYLSPIVQYTILMGNSAAEVIVANVQKKKQLLEKK